MSKYYIVAPCAFMHNGEALYYKTIPREPVEIDDMVASFLGDKVRRVDPFTEPFVESRPKGIEGSTGTSLDSLFGDVLAAPEEPEPVKPKRKRKVEEENPDGDTELRG